MKLLIVDDHPLVRKGISSAISFDDNFSQIMEASNEKEAIKIINSHSPDIGIVDLYLGGENGLDIITKSRKEGKETKFLVLTSSSKKEDYLRAKEARVDGYILKEAYVEDILYAIKLVLRGKKFIDPDLLNYESENEGDKSNLKGLSPRELDVLMELGGGLSNGQIAARLFISENTVKKHISNILSKLDLSHRTEAALFINKAKNLSV